MGNKSALIPQAPNAPTFNGEPVFRHLSWNLARNARTKMPAVRETRAQRREGAEREKRAKKTATHYIIVGSWHSSRARRPLIHAWNSHENHRATRLRARSHAVGTARQMNFCSPRIFSQAGANRIGTTPRVELHGDKVMLTRGFRTKIT